MGLIEIIILSAALAMDAFAVSVCKGLACRKVTAKEMCLAGVWFGGFQALMPLIGYFLGALLTTYITAIDHWLAFILLALIGGKMIKEAFDSNESADENASFSFKTMFILAIATSIDALAVGITLAFLEVNVFLAVALIGIITFILSAAGVKIGSIFGAIYKKKAEIAGGIVLIMIGLKILLEHLGVIN